MQLLLHTRDDHNDGHEGAEEEEEGEEEAGDGGVLGRGAAATEQARGRATEARNLQGHQPVFRRRNWPQNTCPGQSLRRSVWESTLGALLRATHTTGQRSSWKRHQIPPQKLQKTKRAAGTASVENDNENLETRLCFLLHARVWPKQNLPCRSLLFVQKRGFQNNFRLPFQSNPGWEDTEISTRGKQLLLPASPSQKAS